MLLILVWFVYTFDYLFLLLIVAAQFLNMSDNYTVSRHCWSWIFVCICHNFYSLRNFCLITLANCILVSICAHVNLV